jgi:hypothetical protein
VGGLSRGPAIGDACEDTSTEAIHGASGVHATGAESDDPRSRLETGLTFSATVTPNLALMKNIYADRLDSFTFNEFLDALQSAGQETHRLDFKRLEVGRPKLAQVACAFANADGGIIAIGFDDPKNGSIELIGNVDISDKAISALANAINARVQPPVPIEIFGYAGSDGKSFLIIRVARSLTAPHEYIFPDIDRNLPVRRNTSIGSLRLSEIDALRARSHAPPSTSPLGQKPHPVIPYMATIPGAEMGFVVHMRPLIYDNSRLALDADDDYALADVVRIARGKQGSLCADLTGNTTADGLHFFAGDKPHWPVELQPNTVPEMRFSPQQITIDSDGEIALRFLQTNNNALYQYFAALAAAYQVLQGVFYHLRLNPTANVDLIFRLDDRRASSAPVLPNFYKDSFVVDLALDSYAEAFLLTTIRMFRETEQHRTTAEGREILERFEHQHVPDMRGQWT